MTIKKMYILLFPLNIILTSRVCMYGMVNQMARIAAQKAIKRSPSSARITQAMTRFSMIVPQRTVSLPTRILRTTARKTAIIWVPGVCCYAGIQMAKKKIEEIKQECTEWFQKHIINHVVLHADELSKLSELMRKYPAIARVFTDMVVERVNCVDSKALHSIIDHNPEAARLLAFSVAQHITAIKPDVVIRIMEGNMEAVDLFAGVAADHIETMDIQILETILKKKPSSINMFTQAAVARIDKMPWPTLELLARKNNQVTKILFTESLKNIRKMNWAVVGKLLVRHPGVIQVLRRIRFVR